MPSTEKPKNVGQQVTDQQIAQSQELKGEENIEGASQGKSVSETDRAEPQIKQGTPSTQIQATQEGLESREIAVDAKNQALNNFIDEVTYISTHNIAGDIKNIFATVEEKAFSAFMIAAMVAIVVITAVVLGPLAPFLAAVPVVMLVVATGVIVTSMIKSHHNTKQTALTIIKNFAANILEEHSEADCQQALDRLKQLATSKEFYQQVDLFRGELKNLIHFGSLGSTPDPVSKQTQDMLTFMFEFIEQGIPEDQQIAYKAVKKQYLTKLVNDAEVAAKFLDNIMIGSSSVKQIAAQQADSSEPSRQTSKSGLSEKIDLNKIFSSGVQAYLDQINTAEGNTSIE